MFNDGHSAEAPTDFPVLFFLCVSVQSLGILRDEDSILLVESCESLAPPKLKKQEHLDNHKKGKKRPLEKEKELLKSAKKKESNAESRKKKKNAAPAPIATSATKTKTVVGKEAPIKKDIGSAHAQIKKIGVRKDSSNSSSSDGSSDSSSSDEEEVARGTGGKKASNGKKIEVPKSKSGKKDSSSSSSSSSSESSDSSSSGEGKAAAKPLAPKAPAITTDPTVAVARKQRRPQAKKRRDVAQTPKVAMPPPRAPQARLEKLGAPNVKRTHVRFDELEGGTEEKAEEKEEAEKVVNTQEVETKVLEPRIDFMNPQRRKAMEEKEKALAAKGEWFGHTSLDIILSRFSKVQ